MHSGNSELTGLQLTAPILENGSVLRAPLRKVPAVLLRLQIGAGGARCLRSSDTNSNGSSPFRWDAGDSEYLEAQVLEAVSLLPSQGHLFMTLANGGEVEIDHVNPPKGRLLYRSRNPTIFLKILSETEVLLPIIVGDMAVRMLMKALRGDESSVRPNQYQLMRDLIDALNYEIRMVKVTQRVADTYLARIFIGRPGEEEMRSVDARPSDAVNLAVRCKVPIYVNKDIVFKDGVKPVHTSTQTAAAKARKYSNHVSALDRPQNGHDLVAEEMNLVKNMLLAAVEERYSDAAHWRDKLKILRAKRRRIRLL
ncbi:hypothetical protein GOP47_0006097 [Adiantum capillus-veneris]|uniref:BFN domain-containing protein n=1 Tax=Adiantum capillus-veneris TaxID=13818 RepID=A0A9D4V2X4_ADICA|nr:hypothetical protein GOP47_0006097 [Adiantum capillus-veneris]